MLFCAVVSGMDSRSVLSQKMSFSWKKCVICQKTTKEEIRCPLNALGETDPKAVYQSFLTNVAGFKEIDRLPASLTLPADVNANVFLSNKACWHKSCTLQFSASKLEKARESKRKRDAERERDQPRGLPVVKSRRLSVDTNKGPCCMLCDDGSGQLHAVITLGKDENLRYMITMLQDPLLLPKVSGVDLIAAEAKYHQACMTDLRNRYRGHIRKAGQLDREDDSLKESQAFVELIDHINTSVDDGKLTFLLSKLHSLYVNRLAALGVTKQINRTRLKLSLLENLPDAQEQMQGKNVVIVFNRLIQDMLKEAIPNRDFTDKVKILAKASAIVRKDMFEFKGFNFSGQFGEQCQEKSVPTSLKCLISTVAD
jgi:hypothetical protein